MNLKNSKGSVLVGVLVALTLGAFVYVSNSTGFFKVLAKQKTKNQMDVLSKAFTSAIFNYTAYAIKERWCMEQNWSRNPDCGPAGSGGADMKTVVTFPRNLERLLWSKVTLNDMATRYQTIYGVAPTENFGLTALEQTITMADLEEQGVSQPINLVIDDNIKKCLSSVTVKIEKPLTTYYKPQGDEVYLLISVKGNLSINPFNSCSTIKQTPMLKGLVIFYPKTLNQYSVVKAGDLTISDFSDSTAGVNFHGPVYVQKNLILPTTGNHGISFKEKVRIGEGLLLRGTDKFTPYSPGGTSDQFLSQIDTMKGFLNGISLEGEVDQGLPKLFGGSYTYPSGLNMGECTNRKELKDNFSLTKHSRVWVKGAAPNYTFTLSESNEFREYVRHGSFAGFFIYNKDLDTTKPTSKPRVNQYEVALTPPLPTDKPIMRVTVSILGVEYSEVYLGRDSEVKIDFGNDIFYQGQKDVLDIADNVYLDLANVDRSGMGISSKIINDYNDFKTKCDDLKPDFNDPVCKKVDNTINLADPQTNCLPLAPASKKADCIFKLGEVQIAKDTYFATQTALIADLTDFIANTPAVVLKTTSVLSNKEDVKIEFLNQTQFKYGFVDDLDSIKFRFQAFDFAIENSGDMVSGQRAGKNKRMPGPNENGSGNENIMDFKITRNADKSVQAITARKYDGSNLDSAAGATYGTILKNINQSDWNPEPPGNYNTNPAIMYPTDGLSVADAQALDAACDIDTNTLPPPSWDVSFTDYTQFSWLYNVTSQGITITNPSQVTPMPSYTFTPLDMDVGNYQGVPTRSIVTECIVPSNVDFVFGFYVCETLTITGRSTPLNMVGTYIVKNFNIDSASSGAGINFYSIWSPGGIKLLRDKKHLRREKAATDACVFNKPGWYAGLDEDEMADFQTCSPAKFLYSGANNFNWTTIDPEIGITGTGTSVTTQSKIVNRYRRYGANVIWQRIGAE